MLSGFVSVKKFYSQFPYPSLAKSEAFEIKTHSNKILKPSGKTAKDFAGKNVLDLGCGTGEIACALAFNGANVVAIDFSKNSVERAKALAEKYKLKNIEFFQKDLFEVKNVLTEKFDLVLLMGVAHHTKAPKKAFEIACSFLRPKGILLLGLYNSVARENHRKMQKFLRKRFGKNLNKKIGYLNRYFFDGKAGEIEKIYLADKFCNPLEKTVSLKQAMKWINESTLGFLNCEPKIDFEKSFEENEKIWLKQKRSFFILAIQKN